MIKNKKFIYLIIIGFVLLISIIFIWNNYQIQIYQRINRPIKILPPVTKKCGVENCHGLNITCGPNVPDTCTMIYEPGDNCRQFASCQIIDGQCKLKKSPKFDSCKICVEKCEIDYSNNQIKFFECESKCSE